MTTISIYGDLGNYECDKCTEPCSYHDIKPPFKCSKCGSEITRRQYIDSDRRFGMPICAACECEDDLSSKLSISGKIRNFIERLRGGKYE